MDERAKFCLSSSQSKLQQLHQKEIKEGEGEGEGKEREEKIATKKASRSIQGQEGQEGQQGQEGQERRECTNRCIHGSK